MAINIVYQPDPMLVGEAAYQIGQGEYARDQQDQAFRQQQLAEQSRQFDARNALDQQQFGLAQQNSAFEQQLARNREQLARRGLAMDFLNRQNQMGMELALGDQRFGQQMQLEAGRDYRQAQQEESAYNKQYQMFAYQAMQKDLENVRRSMVGLDENQRQQLLDQFYKNWDSYNLPMPTPINPQVPDWQDPAKILQARQQAFPELPWGVDPETGQVGLPRGFNYTTTSQGMQQQFEHQRELEGIKSQNKQDDAAIKARDKELDNQRKTQEHNEDMYQRWQQHDLDMRMKEHEGRMPRKEEFQVEYIDSMSQQPKQKLNIEAYNKAMTEWRSQAPRAPQSPLSQPPQQPPQQGGMPPEWNNLPIGGEMTLPNGVRVRKTGPTSFVRI